MSFSWARRDTGQDRTGMDEMGWDGMEDTRWIDEQTHLRCNDYIMFSRLGIMAFGMAFDHVLLILEAIVCFSNTL